MSFEERLVQASFGGQRPLILTTAPAGQPLNPEYYPRLVDYTSATGQGKGGLPNGTYYCRIDIGGLSAVNLQLMATFGAGTVTISAFTTYLVDNQGGTYLTDAQLDSVRYTYQALAGTGALVTATLQTSTLAASKGEQNMIVKIVVAGGASPVFTQAEINGPR